ncbi:MAG: hypothetical protein ACTIH2_09160 [Anaerococcus sp.]
MELINDLIISQTIFMIAFTLIAIIISFIPVPGLKYSSSYLSKLLGGILLSILLANRVSVEVYADVSNIYKLIISLIIIFTFQFGALKSIDFDTEIDSKNSNNYIYLFLIIPLITFIFSFFLFDLSDNRINNILSSIIKFLQQGKLKVIAYLISYSVFIYNFILSILVVLFYIKNKNRT